MNTSVITLITTGVALLGVLLGFCGVMLTVSVNKKLVEQNAHDEERKSIYKKLNSFYGPFQQLRGISSELHKMFTPAKDENFRTLTALLDGQKFDGNDKILLEQIIDTSKKLGDLIVKESGLVDDEEIRRLLWIANTNFHLIYLAYEGRIVGDAEHFKNYVFPRELDDKVKEEISELKKRLDQLNRV